MAAKHILPSKIGAYLRRLHAEYVDAGNELLAEIIGSARILVIEETDFDNWNGGTYGHDVKFFLPIEVLRRLKVREQAVIVDRLLEDLKACSRSIDQEYVRAIEFELGNEHDPEFLRAVQLFRIADPSPDSLSIWKTDHVRLFISHRDEHKAAARELADELEGYGISAFVAHDTIEPMKTWQGEILKGLQTMEAMLAFVTDNFHKSVWTNQEVGFALGRSIPIIAVKLEHAAPDGFIGSLQAVKGHLDSIAESAPRIYKLVAEQLGNRARMQNSLISAFVRSPDYNETKIRFCRMDAAVQMITNEELKTIVEGFAKNDQLYNCIYITNHYQRLKKFLDRATGRKFKIDRGAILTLQ